MKRSHMLAALCLVAALAVPASSAAAQSHVVAFKGGDFHALSCGHDAGLPGGRHGDHEGGCGPAGPTRSRGHKHGSTNSGHGQGGWLGHFEASVVSFDGSALAVQLSSGRVYTFTTALSMTVTGPDGAVATLTPGEWVRVWIRSSGKGSPYVAVGVQVLGQTPPAQPTPETTDTPDNSDATATPGNDATATPGSGEQHEDGTLSWYNGAALSFDGTTLVVQTDGGVVTGTVTTKTIYRYKGGATALTSGEQVRVYTRTDASGAAEIVGVVVVGSGSSASATPEPTQASGDSSSEGRTTYVEATVVSFDGTTLVVQTDNATLSVTIAGVSVGHLSGAPSTLASGERVKVYSRANTGAVVGVLILS